MRFSTLLLFFATLIPVTLTAQTPIEFDEVAIRNKQLNDAYKYRLAARRANALALRRQYNMSKGPARGWLAISVPYNAMNPMGIGIAAGRIYQPYYLRRPYGSPSCSARRGSYPYFASSMSMDY